MVLTVPLTVPQKVRNLYQRLDRKILKLIPDVYSDDVQFRDPWQALNGLPNLNDYFADLMINLAECRFEFHHSVELPDRGEAVLFWTMHYRHNKLAGGKPLELTGNSHLLFNEKVYYQRNYFDAGSLLYEHIPFVGFAIRQIKKKAGAK